MATTEQAREVRESALDWAQETGRITAVSRPAWASDFDDNPTGTLAVLKRLAPCAPRAAEADAALAASGLFNGAAAARARTAGAPAGKVDVENGTGWFRPGSLHSGGAS